MESSEADGASHTVGGFGPSHAGSQCLETHSDTQSKVKSAPRLCAQGAWADNQPSSLPLLPRSLRLGTQVLGLGEGGSTRGRPHLPSLLLTHFPWLGAETGRWTRKQGIHRAPLVKVTRVLAPLRMLHADTSQEACAGSRCVWGVEVPSAQETRLCTTKPLRTQLHPPEGPGAASFPPRGSFQKLLVDQPHTRAPGPGLVGLWPSAPRALLLVPRAAAPGG